MSGPNQQPEDLLEAYRLTIEPLYAFVARRSGGSRELAEDVVQETYLRAVNQWKHEDAPREPLAWLQTVARNLLASHLRRQRPETLDPGAVDRFLSNEVDQTPQRAIVWGLGQLDESAARLLEAFHLDGKPVGRIARETGLSERAVEGRLRRAREALRRRLEPLMARSDGGDA